MSEHHILGDWGSSRLRLWLVCDDTIVDRCEGPSIIGLVGSPVDALQAAIEPWFAHSAAHSITLCGMAGARGGLMEVPYAETPLTAAEWATCASQFVVDGLSVRIAAGCALRQSAGGRDDTMRGEETQVFGALELAPALSEGKQLVILPGTHSKWVWLDDGRIADFRTFVTGELFALLQSSSLLTLAETGDGIGEDEGFAIGITRSLRQPLLGCLFTARAAQLRSGKSGRWASGYLSGLLIGSEMAEMRSANRLPAGVTIIGEPALARRYAQGLASYGVETMVLDGEACALAGLRIIDADH